MIRGIRLWLAVAILLATSALLYGRGDKDRQVTSDPLASLPMQIDKWHGRDRGLDPRIIEVLGKGDFLSRLYTSSAPEPPVDLFIGYFPSQRSGSSIHSPKNCLPGAGWKPVESAHLFIESPGKRPTAVNRYIVEKGLDRALVLYWYQAHGRATPSEYWAKFYLVSDAIRMNRSDGALVRVVTVLQNGESPEAAEGRAVGFAQRIIPILDEYIPR